MKNSGIIVKLSDGRNVIVYDKQPLLKDKGLVVLNLVDDKQNLIKNEKGLPRTLIKRVDLYNEEMVASTLIGFVD